MLSASDPDVQFFAVAAYNRMLQYVTKHNYLQNIFLFSFLYQTLINFIFLYHF